MEVLKKGLYLGMNQTIIPPMMTLQKPTIYTFDSTVQYETYVHMTSQPTMSTELSYLTPIEVFIPLDAQGKRIEQRIELHDWNTFFTARALINNAINSAEIIYFNIREYLVEKAPLEKVNGLMRNNFEDTINAFIVDFKSLPKLRTSPYYTSDEQIDNKVLLLHDFRKCRNIFTHGRVRYILDSATTLIQNVEGGVLRTYEITPDMLQSYSDAFITLWAMLEKVKENN